MQQLKLNTPKKKKKKNQSLKDLSKPGNIRQKPQDKILDNEKFKTSAYQNNQHNQNKCQV